MRQCYNSASVAAGSNRQPSKNNKSGASSVAGSGSGSAALWQQVRERSAHALRVGALEPIESDCQQLEDSGIPFSLRVARGLERKSTVATARTLEQPSGQDGQRPNPFLPYDPDLFVSAVGDSHVCLLNKFMVLEQHALIVTREFESQESLLTSANLAALSRCLRETDGFGFYNAGADAGASQAHKHLQLVPTPLGDGGRVPIERLLNLPELTSRSAGVTSAAALPFANALIRVDDCVGGGTAEADGELHSRYRSLLVAMHCDQPPLRPYNLLMTREWMLLVPRRCESSIGIEVNSLGLAGALFVRDPEQLAALRAHGPLQLLRDVTLPPA